MGRSGRDQVAAAYAVHGPKTVLVLARPLNGARKPFAAAGQGGSKDWCMESLRWQREKLLQQLEDFCLGDVAEV